MASKADILAGSAFLRLFLKDDLSKSFKASISAVTTATTAAGATIAGALTASFAGFISVGGAIDDLAARTGASTDSLQKWKFAAEQSGASTSDLEAAIRRMAKNGMSPAQFEQLGTSIAAIADPGKRAAAAMEEFGKSGTKLLPMFRDLAELKARSDAIGPILTPEEVALADELGDSFDVMTEALTRLGHQIAVAFGPALKTALEGAIGAIATMAEGVREIANANPFGSGGDWLDKIVELEKKLFTNPSELFARGKAATSGGGTFGGGEMDGPEAATSELNITKSIIEAERRRIALAREFMTTREKFIEKETQLLRAIAEVNRNRVTGFISGEQAAIEKRALETALMRHRTAEAERLARARPRPAEAAKPVEEAIEALMPLRAVASSTSAAGAFAMQAGGGGIGRQTLSEIKAMRKTSHMMERHLAEMKARRDRPGIFR